MHRFINQINVSITTNRTCTLRCDHCYIAPHLFDDRTQMTKETFKKIFDQIEALYEFDNNLHEIEWEMIGGETTMMPFEWWEEMLPYALGRITELNKRLKVPGSINFLSNLIYSDKRYTELFNKYGSHPYFCLYTSWEPDTNRFGKNNKREQYFMDTLASIHVENKILDIILTKEICNMGAKAILDKFVPLGITDFSCKQLSPYGSGKAFFHPNMPSFKEMTQFLMDMSDHKPDHITFTPEEEMISSLFRGTSFQCNGNFKYDLAIEPDGTCTFNASQTASEAVIGYKTLYIDDPSWAKKVCYENTIEENRKLTLRHDECDGCEYLNFCNAGWYHYKIAHPSDIDQYKNNECSGFKSLWDKERDALPIHFDRAKNNHREALKTLGRPERHNDISYLSEKIAASDYEDFFVSVHQDGNGILIDKVRHYGKTILERLWYYDAMRKPIKINTSTLMKNDDAEEIIRHYIFNNFHSVEISPAQIMIFVESYPDSRLSKQIKDAVAVIKGLTEVERGNKTSGPVYIKQHNEVYRWVYNNEIHTHNKEMSSITPKIFTIEEYEDAIEFREQLNREKELKSYVRG